MRGKVAKDCHRIKTLYRGMKDGVFASTLFIVLYLKYVVPTVLTTVLDFTSSTF